MCHVLFGLQLQAISSVRYECQKQENLSVERHDQPRAPEQWPQHPPPLQLFEQSQALKMIVLFL